MRVGTEIEVGIVGIAKQTDSGSEVGIEMLGREGRDILVGIVKVGIETVGRSGRGGMVCISVSEPTNMDECSGNVRTIVI
jgi:hypothetical protein